MNAYEVKAGIGVIAGKTVRSMPERLRGFNDWRYINPLYLTYTSRLSLSLCCNLHVAYRLRDIRLNTCLAYVTA